MHEVTAYKLCMVQGNKVPRIPRIFTSGRESNGIFCKGKNPAVGNGYFMGIAPKVFNGIAKSVKSFFRIFCVQVYYTLERALCVIFLKTCKMVFHYYFCR